MLPHKSTGEHDVTIVVAVATTSGLVLASDSATTQQLPTVGGDLRTASIWNSADKIFNLRKTWPIGTMTFGRANFSGLPVATHCKDLRARFAGQLSDSAYPALDAASFAVEDVAQSLRDYFRKVYDDDPGDLLGFIVGGFGSGEQSPELWQVLIGDSDDKVEQLMPPGENGIFHQGMTDAISRLIDGVAQDTPYALTLMGVPTADAEQAAEVLKTNLTVTLAWRGMPLGESVDLARFLVETTIHFVRFAPGDPSVGGPVEIAALTRHEGFKWVQRKHYYPPDLNPIEDVS
jgi:hypothetical protein